MYKYKMIRTSTIKTAKIDLEQFNTPDNILIGTGIVVIGSALLNPLEMGSVIGATGLGMITTGLLDIVADKRIEEYKNNRNK